MADSPSSPKSSSRSRVGTWLRRALIVALVLANLGVFGAWLLARNLSSTVEENLTRDTNVVRALTPTSSPDDSSGAPTPPSTFLIIGSDSRQDLPDDLAGNFGSTSGGGRSDVIMLLQVFPDESRAQMLSLPRDLRVEIPGHGTNKINAAFAFGGAELMVQTVKDETGLPIHHYAEIDFAGFAATVDQLGGVKLSFAYPARDTQSGFSADAGSQVLDGAQALAYARSRHYQEFRGGTWVSVDASDIGRTRRQQQLILAILDEVKRPSSLADVSSLLEVAAGHLTVDAGLEQKTIVGLGWAMRSVGVSSVEAVTLPTYGQMIDGSSYQIPKEPEASLILSAFATGAPLVASSGEPIRVRVLNGNGIAGSAGRAAALLTGESFEIVEVGDAESSDFVATVVITRPDRVALGEAVVAALGFGQVTSGTVPSDVDAIVIVGSDGPAA